MGDDGALLGESRHVLGLLAEEGLRNEKREIGVHSAGFLEHSVKGVLHLLPDRVAIRLYHHTSPDGGLLRQVCLHNQIIVPLRIVLRPFCHFLCHIFFAVFVNYSYYCAIFRKVWILFTREHLCGRHLWIRPRSYELIVKYRRFRNENTHNPLYLGASGTDFVRFSGAVCQ